MKIYYGMITSSRQKYLQLFRGVKNWPIYFSFKFFGKGKTAVFILRNTGRKLSVPYSMLRVFKEVFMQNGYDEEFVNMHLKPNSIVMDIGANIGMFSVWISNLYPTVKLLAFEPFATNFAMLKSNTFSENSLISRYEKAVTGHPKETVEFFIGNEESLSDSASVFSGFFGNTTKKIVLAVSLAEIIQQNPERIGLLKLDCEGSEYDILYNTDVSFTEKIDSMIIETHDLDDLNMNFGGMLHFLESRGYSFYHRPVVQGLNMIWAWKP